MAGSLFAPLLIALTVLVGSMTLLAAKLMGDFTAEGTASAGKLDEVDFRGFARDVGLTIVRFLALTQLAAAIFIVVPGLSSAFGAGLNIGGILGNAVLGGIAEAGLLEMSTVLFGGQKNEADAPSAHHAT